VCARWPALVPMSPRTCSSMRAQRCCKVASRRGMGIQQILQAVEEGAGCDCVRGCARCGHSHQPIISLAASRFASERQRLWLSIRWRFPPRPLAVGMAAGQQYRRADARRVSVGCCARCQALIELSTGIINRNVGRRIDQEITQCHLGRAQTGADARLHREISGRELQWPP